MRHTVLSVLVMCLISIFVLSGCSNSTDALGEFTLQDSWQRHAVVDTGVTVLENDREGLLIGTEAGLFQLQGDKFIFLGLDAHEIQGVIRMNSNSLLAGTRASSLSSGEPTLFRLKNGETSWEPFMNNFGGIEGKYTWIEIGPVANSFPSDIAYVRGSGSIVRTIDGGQNWEIMNGEWNNVGGLPVMFLFIDPYHQGYIWTGGVTNILQPSLWKSTDYGHNWKFLEAIREVDSTIVEAIVYDIMSHREDPNLVLAGLGGAFAAANNVKKSTDGGQNWQVVLDSTGVHTFTRSRDNPEVIYASGRDASTKLFFVKTSDFGETWEKEIFEEGPSVVTTNDLAVITVKGQEVLFLGTDQGLYSYTLGN